MTDDIELKIGVGDPGNMATRLPGMVSCRASISANARSYWAHRCLLDVELIIMKDSEEGKYLCELIEAEPFNPVEVDDYLDEIVHLNITTKDLKTAIRQRGQNMLEAGRNEARADMRRSMGVRQ